MFQPLAKDTIVRIASMTKPIAGVAMMMLLIDPTNDVIVVGMIQNVNSRAFITR